MGSRRVLPIAFALLMGVPALAQGPTYGIGRTPTAEEIRARDISIGPTGRGAPGRQRQRQGGRGRLSHEGVCGMPRRHRDRRLRAHLEKQKPHRILTSGRGDESCRFARHSRPRSGTTSIAECRSIARGR